ncbi:ABC transporter permease [Clostridium felsineum]|uniref:ABC transporter permease n=1 Tax=Clostridium felsineum TaxID=36839 RepID=UPI00214D158C|nr:ABC transporter permease [Clostridium felsineum]MCR3761752.1 ABC transporter permease [Clostridium felsineum]
MESFVCLKLEFMKFRKSFIKFLFIFPAVLSAAMLTIGLYFRKNSFISYGGLKDSFSGVLLANNSILAWNIILLLFVIAMSISLFYIETANDSLTSICSSNLKRGSIYLGKWMFLFISTLLMISIGIFILIIDAKIFGIPIVLDNGVIMKYICFELFFSLGLVSFQLFLISILKDITTSTIVSLLAAVGFNAVHIGKGIVPYIPYLYYSNSTPFSDTNILRQSLITSLIYFVVFLVIGVVTFNFKDIRE